MILVTGGTGLIGSFIVRELINNGKKVRILKRDTSNLSLLDNICDQLEFAEGDLLDVSSLNTAFQGIDFIIHSAGLISFEQKDRDKLYKINVEGTANLVNVSLGFPIKKFIYISSIAAIGKKKGINKIEESAKWENDGVSEYAKSKYLAELEVWRGSSEGLAVGILNPSVVLGPADWNKGSTSLFKYIWDRKPFYTSGIINYVDVRDVARAAFILLRSNIINERFILNGGSTDYKSFFNKVAKSFNRPGPSINISIELLNLIWILEKARSLITNTSPLITKEISKSALNKTVYINTKAKEILNLSFKDLNETINWVCTEIVKKYNIQINNL